MLGEVYLHAPPLALLLTARAKYEEIQLSWSHVRYWRGAKTRRSSLSHRGGFSEGLYSAPATICHIAIILFPAYHGGDRRRYRKFLLKVAQKNPKLRSNICAAAC
jgi:hypothetical protein